MLARPGARGMFRKTCGPESRTHSAVTRAQPRSGTPPPPIGDGIFVSRLEAIRPVYHVQKPMYIPHEA